MDWLDYTFSYLKAAIKYGTFRKPFFILPRNNASPAEELALFCHVGLGDLIVCNGLIRHLARQFKLVHIPMNKRNRTSAEFMFSDLDNIRFHEAESLNEMIVWQYEMEWQGMKIMDVSQHNPEFRRNLWDQEFYRLANVPHEERWRSFKLPPVDSPLKLPEGKFIFVHDDTSRGLSIVLETDLPIVRPTNIGHVFLWLHAIQNAEEIHCIDSSFFHIVESVETKTNKLFFHNIRIGGITPSFFRKKWFVTQSRNLTHS